MKLLRVAIGSAAVLALGAAGTLVGFAVAGQGAPANFTTETATIVGPVGEDDTSLSPELGTTVVSVPVAGGAPSDELAITDLDPSVVAALKELIEADDPGLSPTFLEAELPSLIEAPLPAGDPCAPVDGDPPADCPSGVRSTILPYLDSEAPEFWVLGQVNPGPEEGADDAYWCPPAELGEGDVQFGIFTDAPATTTMRYWPTSRPDEVETTVVMTSPEAQAAWETAFAESRDLSGTWLRVRHCIVLRDLDPYVDYSYELSGVDKFDRAASSNGWFRLPDDRTVPPTRVLPWGDNLIVTSIPHRDSENAVTRGYLLEEGDPYDCALVSDRPQVDRYGSSGTVILSEQYLADNEYLPVYTRRSSSVLRIPEGSTVLVCIDLVERTEVSFELGVPIWTHTTVVQSPDQLVPTVSLTQLSVRKDLQLAPGDLKIRAFRPGGAGCPTYDAPASTFDDQLVIDEPIELCVLDASAGGAGTVGRIAIGTSLEVNSQLRSDYIVLRLGSRICTGVCELPEPSVYRLELLPFPMADGSLVAAGTMKLQVDWSQGRVSGRSDWYISAGEGADPGVPLRDTPQMDALETLNETAASPGSLTRTIWFDLRTDRPVSYTATLEGCVLPSTVTSVTGESEGETRVTFTGACVGSDYTVAVELVDRSGSRSVWGPDSRTHFWPGRITTTPEYDRITYSYVVTSEDRSLHMLTPFTIRVGPTAIFHRDPACMRDGNYSELDVLSDEVALASEVPIRIELRAIDAVTTSTGCGPRAGAELGAPIVLTTTVSLGDLRRGVTLTSPDGSAFEIEVDLIAR
jgi:hypothetical protein